MSGADTTPPAGSDPLVSALTQQTAAIEKYGEIVGASARAEAKGKNGGGHDDG